MYKTIIFIFLIFITLPLSAQQQEGVVSYGTVLDGDTVPKFFLDPVYILEYRKFPSKKAKRRYTRLVRYVKNVYPYAKLAGEKLRAYDVILRETKTKRERHKIMKRVEEEIRDEHEGKLRNLYIGEGKILVKLIDRECNQSSYTLLKELRGSVSATLWQGFGRLFGYNLKVRYDPYGDDRQIEKIVQMIDRGII